MDRRQWATVGRQVVVVVAVLWATFGLISAQAKPDPRCDVINGLTRDPIQCNGYLICSSQQVMRRIRCPNSQKFDQETKECTDGANVECGYRPIVPVCEVEPIHVTIEVNNSLATPPYAHAINLTAPKQSLHNFLLMAAGSDPAFQFETAAVEDQGEFVNKIGDVGTYNAGQTFRFWELRDSNGTTIATNIDTYEPNDGDVVTFHYLEVKFGG